eukprot:c20191_g1_i2 orf=199-2073(+)
MAGNDGECRHEQRDEGEEKQEEATSVVDLSFVHRSKVLEVRVPTQATLVELGQKLVSMSGIAPHTLRLLLPRTPALLPFSPQHSSLSILQSGICQGRLVTMMGVLPGEIKEVFQEAGNANERTIIGFLEEDKRAKRWRTARSGVSRNLPQGQYIFCAFRTLELPGVQLNPPAGKAMDIMHKLASDAGIVAIMNKHRWRVGVMTEMAPVGYVGISPKCILGYNKNQGQEISLRLRTDDLKGFRKYESIKQTLLHELAHMVHSEHDANFHALNKQLSEEAMSLDWTKSGGHSLGGFKISSDEEEEEEPTDAGGQKLGGSKEHNQLGARSAAALAALLRLRNNTERVRDDNFNEHVIGIVSEGNEVGSQSEFDVATKQEPDPDDCDSNLEPDPDEAQSMTVDEDVIEPYLRSAETIQDPLPGSDLDMDNVKDQQEESAPLDLSFGCESCLMHPETVSGFANSKVDNSGGISSDSKEAGSITGLLAATQQLDSSIETLRESFKRDIAESAGEDSSLKSMQEYTEKVCQRLQDAIIKLKEESSPSEAAATIQSLSKILRNLKEHPHEDKFKRLRKMNVAFQNRIARFKGAMEVLHEVGFSDGVDYVVLKRDDPVLLWLAQTFLEACIEL